MLAERADGGELKQVGNWNLALQRLLQTGMHPHDGQRVGAQVEEVVVESELRHVESALPQVLQRFFQWSGRGLSRLRALGSRHWCRQRRAIDSAELSALETAAGVIGAAFHRERLIDDVRRARERAVVNLKFSKWFKPFSVESTGAPHPFSLD